MLEANAISQSGVIAVDDGVTLWTGMSWIISTQANVLGDVTVASGAGAVSLTENEAILIAAITRTDGDLTLNAGRPASDQSKRSDRSRDDGAVSLTGGAITLTQANVLGDVTVASELKATTMIENGYLNSSDVTPNRRRSYFKMLKQCDQSASDRSR